MRIRIPSESLTQSECARYVGHRAGRALSTYATRRPEPGATHFDRVAALHSWPRLMEMQGFGATTEPDLWKCSRQASFAGLTSIRWCSNCALWLSMNCEIQRAARCSRLSPCQRVRPMTRDCFERGETDYWRCCARFQWHLMRRSASGPIRLACHARRFRERSRNSWKAARFARLSLAMRSQTRARNGLSRPYEGGPHRVGHLLAQMRMGHLGPPMHEPPANPYE